MRFIDFRVAVLNGSFLFEGEVKISEVMPMNIEVEMGLTRCNVDKTGCIFFHKVYFPRICEKLNVKTSAAYSIIKGVKPKANCPFPAAEYKLSNDSSLSLDMFKLLPIDGYYWKLRVIFHEKKGAKHVRKLGCVEYGVAIVNKTRRPKLTK